METTTLNISGMTCGGCTASVKRVLEALPGVSHAEVSLDSAQAEVTFDPAQTGREAMAAAVQRAGFQAR